MVASESYTDFVAALQKDISESLSDRPRMADVKYFIGKLMRTAHGTVEVTERMANQIYRYLVKNDYTDYDDMVSAKYHDAVKDGALATLPEDLLPYEEQVFQLIDSVYSDAGLPEVEDDRGAKTNPLNDNFEKRESSENYGTGSTVKRPTVCTLTAPSWLQNAFRHSIRSWGLRPFSTPFSEVSRPMASAMIR